MFPYGSTNKSSEQCVKGYKRMPTPESRAAFEKLVETRARLNEITKQLHELDSRHIHKEDNARLEMEHQRDNALRAFGAAVQVFIEAVDKLKIPTARLSA